jgi:hypothetical protein
MNNKRRNKMKYKLVETGENYIKVYPYFDGSNPITDGDLHNTESEIKRHVDDIAYTEIIKEQQYQFKDEYANYIEDSLVELCTSMAYQRDLLDEYNSWTVWWLDKNKEKCSTYINSLEELLDEVSRHKDINISGNLSERQKILVDMAKLLCD